MSEFLDRLVIFSDKHLNGLIEEYIAFFNGARRIRGLLTDSGLHGIHMRGEA